MGIALYIIFKYQDKKNGNGEVGRLKELVEFHEDSVRRSEIERLEAENLRRQKAKTCSACGCEVVDGNVIVAQTAAGKVCKQCFMSGNSKALQIMGMKT